MIPNRHASEIFLFVWCRFAVTSNVMSCGFSFEEEDVFDVAYAIFEFHANTPPLSDMVQLCARARQIKDKTLKYIVMSHNHMRCEQDQLETQALRARRGALDPYPAQQAIHDVHVEEFYEHRRHCASIYYALPAVREALTIAFSHTNTSDLTYVRPSLIQHRQQQQEKNRRVPYRMRRYSDVLTRLP